MKPLSTLIYDVVDGIGWVTLNRPDVLNAFNAQMQDELQAVWVSIREDERVRVAVLTGMGERAFCTGIDREEALGGGQRTEVDADFKDPGQQLGPKSNDLWKPVVVAVNGMACGGAFYLLGEADIIIAADHATFFDPHVTYGMPSSYESMLMVGRMPLGEVLRMQLMGAAERLSAKRAHQMGLVSEVVPPAELAAAARHVASTIAASPTLAVQATVRAVWAAAQTSRQQALVQAYSFIAMGMTEESLAEGQQRFASGKRVVYRLR